MSQTAILVKEKGVVRLDKPFDFMCSQLRNGRYKVTIERYTEPRTISQNALMWMWFTCIEQETGTDKQDVHDYYCNLFLRRTAVINGMETVIAGSTSKLNTLQMTDFLNKVKADAATEWALGFRFRMTCTIRSLLTNINTGDNDMEITKAKVTKDNTLVATYTDETGTITVEGKNLVTNDLINAFKALVPHMAFLCEQKEADGKEFLEDMPDNIDSILEVTGYTVGGDGDSRGVTLTGKRFLKSNKVLNLNAPFTKFTDENEDYAFQFELEQAIESCSYEVNEYIFNKKWKVVQQELPFEEQAVADVQADAVPEAETVAPASPDIEAFQKIMDNSKVTIEVNGKKIKPRSSGRHKNTQLAS